MKNIINSVLLRHRLAVAPGHRDEQKMWYRRGLAWRGPAYRLDEEGLLGADQSSTERACSA
jgi:hypothetical protein